VAEESSDRGRDGTWGDGGRVGGRG